MYTNTVQSLNSIDICLHVELVIFFYHSITWAIPNICNLKLKKCSINIIQTLHSVYMHIEDGLNTCSFRLHQLCTVNVIQ
jgi:hypothetical protein